MSKYKGVTVAAAQKIANEFDKDMVIILAYDVAHMRMHTTTYGKTAEDKESAAMLGNQLASACGADLSQKEVYADFHDDQPDHYVQIDDPIEIDVTLLIEIEGNYDWEDLSKRLHELPFVHSTGDVIVPRGNTGISVVVRMPSVAQMYRLLPACKAKIREVLSAAPAVEDDS